MIRWVWPLMVCLALLMGCGSEPPPAGGPQAKLDLGRERADALWVSLRSRQQRVAALCGLASKAAPAYPEMARSFLLQALEAAQGLAGPQARRLAEQMKKFGQERGGEKYLANARRAQDMVRAAWPLALVARCALVVDLDLAARALELGLQRARANPDPAGRDRDLAELVEVMGRGQAGRAREIAREIGDALLRARAWRALAELTRQPSDLAKAVEAAGQVEDAGQGALCLAHTAGLAFSWNPQDGVELFARAFDLAGHAAPPKRAAFLQGEVAAALASLDPRAGFDLARRVQPGQGARFKALRIIARSLLASDPRLGRQVMDAAIREAAEVPLNYERNRALGLLAADLAQADPRAARAILEQVPASQYLLRGEAEAAMVLAQAGENVRRAALQAQGIGDNYVRLGVLARLADIATSAEPALARELYRQALSESARMGGLLPRRALIRAWAALDAETAVRLAGEVSQPAARAQTYVILAKVLHERGNGAGAQWCLQVAVETINRMNVQETLDKVRLLGDMGREWSVIEVGQANTYFALGAKAAKDLG